MDPTYPTFDQLLMNGGDGVDSDSKHIVEEDDQSNTGDLQHIPTTTTSHSGSSMIDHPTLTMADLSSTHPSTNDTAATSAALDEPDSADDVVTKLLKEHRQQMGDDDHTDGDDLHDDDEDAEAVVNRQLSASFGEDHYDDTNIDSSLHHRHHDLHTDFHRHDDTDRTVLDMVTSAASHDVDTLQPADNDEEAEEDDLSTPPPRICRICHKMDDRPVLRFAPVEFDMNVVHAAPHVQTFPLDICVHVFCGKTASILPNVNQPEYEILTKAGIKNKHGIGGEVNAALSRTRCATLPPEAGKEKQFYLVREFEAHLAAVRGYIQTNQQHHQQQKMLMHQNHFIASLQPSIVIHPAPPPSALTRLPSPNGSTNGSSHSVQNVPSLNNSYSQPKQQPTASQSMVPLPSSTTSQALPALSSPTSSSGNQYSQLLQRLNSNNGSMNHQTLHNNDSNNIATLNAASGTLTGTPTGHSSQQPTQQQQQHQQAQNLSTLMMNSIGGLDQLYSSTLGNGSSDILSMNQNSSNNTGSPTLEQLESMLQQQQQIQQQQNSYSTKKALPVKVGSTNSKYQSPQVALNSNSGLSSDFKVHCECGGTHLSMNTTRGLASYKSHLMTKRHQKYVADQEQIRFAQIMSTGSSNSNLSNMTMMNPNLPSNNNNAASNMLIYPSSATLPLLSNTTLLLGQNQLQSFIENMNNNSSSISHTTIGDNNNGGNSSSNSSVYGAAV